MAYQLSASKLQTYHRCPQAYYFRYELGLKTAAFFGSAALGTALHQALAQIYWDWSYTEPLPEIGWIHHCWHQHSGSLSPAQVEDGKEILENYYHKFIADELALRRPLAVEGKIQGRLQVANLEFAIAKRCCKQITGRYDRIDYLEDGLELIDYKSKKEVKLPLPDEIDLQIGLYYLALEQKYKQSLQQLSLLYLRTGEKFSFDATLEHKQLVYTTIGELTFKLLKDELWEALPGEHCARCTYSRYCGAVQNNPEPLPENAKTPRKIQLALNL